MQPPPTREQGATLSEREDGLLLGTWARVLPSAPLRTVGLIGGAQGQLVGRGRVERVGGSHH